MGELESASSTPNFKTGSIRFMRRWVQAGDDHSDQHSCRVSRRSDENGHSHWSVSQPDILTCVLRRYLAQLAMTMVLVPRDIIFLFWILVWFGCSCPVRGMFCVVFWLVIP